MGCLSDDNDAAAWRDGVEEPAGPITGFQLEVLNYPDAKDQVILLLSRVNSATSIVCNVTLSPPTYPCARSIISSGDVHRQMVNQRSYPRVQVPGPCRSRGRASTDSLLSPAAEPFESSCTRVGSAATGTSAYFGGREEASLKIRLL